MATAQGTTMRAVYGILGLCFVAAPAAAQAEECAEGDWNCQPPSEPGGADPAESPDPAPAPPPGEQAPADQGSDPGPPPAVIYETRRSWDEEEAGPPPVVIVDPRTKAGDPPPEEISVRPRTSHLKPRVRDRWDPLWGVSARVQKALGASRGRDIDMQGVGVGFRYRPMPHFALDFGFDYLGGRDWHGDRRRESVVSASALVYFNPESTVQIYMPVGLHGSGARVDVESAEGTNTRSYRYLGAQAGIGAEIRLGSSFSIPIELLGFVRGRTDGAARRQPEYVDADTHLVTNTSAGGLLRAGVTFYW